MCVGSLVSGARLVMYQIWEAAVTSGKLCLWSRPIPLPPQFCTAFIAVPYNSHVPPWSAGFPRSRAVEARLPATRLSEFIFPKRLPSRTRALPSI